MLQLYSNRYANILDNNILYIDRNILGANRFRNNRVNSKYIGHAAFPLLMNELGFSTNIIVEPSELPDEDTYSFTSTLDLITDGTPTNTIKYIKYLTEDVDGVALDPEVWKCHDEDNLGTIYRIAMEKTAGREGLESIKVRVWTHKINKIVIVAIDYDDYNQASEYFLTLGLVPVLFPTLKPKFSEPELDYFKVLVNRAQVKRIANVNATTAFDLIQTLTKYEAILNDVRMASAISGLAQNRINNARRQLNNASSNIDSALRQYGQYVEAYNKYAAIVESFERGEDDLVDDLKRALKTEGVVDFRLDGTCIRFTVKTPIEFYEPDIAEMAMRNYNGDIKRVFMEVFAKQNYQMHVATEFIFDLDNPGNCTLPREASYGMLQTHQAMYNPHFNFFSCFGDYKQTLYKSHADGDLLMFVNIAIASNKNINFADGAVIRRWMENLNDNYNNGGSYGGNVTEFKCITDNEGKAYSIKDVMTKLRTPAGAQTRDVNVEEQEYHEDEEGDDL